MSVINNVASSLPAGVEKAFRRVFQSVRRAYGRFNLRGEGVECPVCHWQGHAFMAYRHRSSAQCPKCGALERHRFLSHYIATKQHLLEKDLHVLHFAPEPFLRKKFASTWGSNYVTTDLYESDVDIQMDITNNYFRDDLFDLVICSHVLEHIADDAAAMSELARVLKPGGNLLVQVPVYQLSGGETFEDPHAVTPEDQLRLFDQVDHVRKYGADIEQRLSRAGFDVVRVSPASQDDSAIRYGLESEGHIDGESIFHCTRRSNPTPVG